ncbi:MAG: helix-turn-helix domain-containing protein [Alphaproteobacteria bacterium]|nr:helix-turn-helix domain-containing protein [Alphaproteobacteria bacterium]
MHSLYSLDQHAGLEEMPSAKFLVLSWDAALRVIDFEGTVMTAVRVSGARTARGVVDRQIGLRLRYRRLALGVSQAELGDAAKVSGQQIQKYETAKNRISASALYAIACKLDVDTNFFFVGLDAPGAGGFEEGTEGFVQELLRFAPEASELLRAFAEITEGGA